jgi:hypothetical protein
MSRDQSRRVEALEAAVTGGGAEALRDAARRYLTREEDPEKRRMPEALLAATDKEVCAYIAWREHLNERAGHPDATRDSGYFALLETLLRRVSPEDADGWRVLRDLYFRELRSEDRTYPPTSRHSTAFYIPAASKEAVARVYAMWDIRHDTWRQRQESMAALMQERKQAVVDGTEPVTDLEAAKEMVREAVEVVERAVDWSADLDDVPECPCLTCHLSETH